MLVVTRKLRLTWRMSMMRGGYMRTASLMQFCKTGISCPAHAQCERRW